MAIRAAAVVILLAIAHLDPDGVVSATAFGCKNAMIADEWRDMVLNLHNRLRRELARGNVQGKAGPLPVGKNIKQLYWDCNMEEMARAEAEKCPSTAPTVGANGVSFESIKTKAQCNSTSTIETTLRTWWRDGAKKQADQTKVQGNDLFSQMAYSESDSFACTYHPCSNSKMSFLCLYNQDGKGNAGNLYENGNNPSEICGSCQNVCEDALCNVAPAAVAPVDVLCQTAANTQKALMTDDLRNQALNMHNYYRRLLASGWAKDAKLMYAKPSTAMPTLEYDCALEETIMLHLKDCVGTAATTNIAQNFLADSDYKSKREDILQRVIQGWWAPLEAIGIEDNVYTANVDSSALKTYVPMAHHETLKVGCATKTCERIGKTLVQCAYSGAPTAADDLAIYPSGKTCSKCSTLPATPKCSPLGGLCIPSP